jgi:hypothetical protein
VKVSALCGIVAMFMRGYTYIKMSRKMTAVAERKAGIPDRERALALLREALHGGGSIDGASEARVIRSIRKTREDIWRKKVADRS